jgi:predicted small integral membrane protein
MEPDFETWLGWMAWTPITGLFFGAIGLLLAIYTALGLRAPSLPHKGFLPMPTTRGDRLFVALLGAAFINLAWAGLTDRSQWLAAAIWLPYTLVVGRWG